VSSAAAIALILTGTFEQIVALAAVIFLLTYIACTRPSSCCAVENPICRGLIGLWDILHHRGRAIGCVMVLIAALMEDPRSGVIAAVLIGACALVHGRVARRSKREAPGSDTSIEIGR